MSNYIQTILSNHRDRLNTEIAWEAETYTAARESVRISEIKLHSLRGALREVDDELARWNT